MEGTKKNVIMTIIIVVCLVSAGVITYKGCGSETGHIPGFEGETVWVKCNNPDCGAAYEIGKRDYFVEITKRDDGVSTVQPALTCKECKEDSVYRAVKCGKCGLIFFYGAAGRGEYSDACPDCGYSKIGEDRIKAAEERMKKREGG